MDASAIKAIAMTFCIVGFTGVAAYVDWRTQKLPNWLTVSCFVSALVFHFVAGFFGEYGGVGTAFIQLGWSLVGFATGFGILMVLWLIGGGGGGDVKMMGAMGAWLMPQLTLYVFIISAAITVLFYFRQIVSGEAKKMKESVKTAKRTKDKSKIIRHHAHYAFRAGLAVWLVLGYFICMMPKQEFPLFQTPRTIAEEAEGRRSVADEPQQNRLSENVAGKSQANNSDESRSNNAT